MLYQKILYHSIVGYLTILSDDYYIRKIEFGKRDPEDGVQTANEHPLLKRAEKQLTEYLEGKRKAFDLPLMPNGTVFQKSVWAQLQQIPYGQTWSYQHLAEMIQRPKAIRAVGGGCHKNPLVIVIPCHRVIGTNGSLTGFGGGLSVKRALLDLEKKYRDHNC